jgi:hypothetical protein
MLTTLMKSMGCLLSAPRRKSQSALARGAQTWGAQTWGAQTRGARI